MVKTGQKFRELVSFHPLVTVATSNNWILMTSMWKNLWWFKVYDHQVMFTLSLIFCPRDGFGFWVKGGVSFCFLKGNITKTLVIPLSSRKHTTGFAFYKYFVYKSTKINMVTIIHYFSGNPAVSSFVFL